MNKVLFIADERFLGIIQEITFGGNPLACAVSIALLEVIKIIEVIEEEYLVERSLELGNYMMAELKKSPKIIKVQGWRVVYRC